MQQNGRPIRSRKQARATNSEIKKTAKQFGWSLKEIPRATWEPRYPKENTVKPYRVLQSSEFLVQLFQERDGIVRITVNRTQVTRTGWAENITWDDLQRIKRECGFGANDAVEVYPSDEDVVNVANMRHLFVYTTAKLNFIWRKQS